jgi:hypothetical protein
MEDEYSWEGIRLGDSATDISSRAPPLARAGKPLAFVESKMPSTTTMAPTAAIDRQAVVGLAWPGALPPENKSWPYRTQCKRTTTSQRLLRSLPSLVATVPLVSGGQSRRAGEDYGCCGEPAGAAGCDGRGTGRKKSEVEEDRRGEAWWRRWVARFSRDPSRLIFLSN